MSLRLVRYGCGCIGTPVVAEGETSLVFDYCGSIGDDGEYGGTLRAVTPILHHPRYGGPAEVSLADTLRIIARLQRMRREAELFREIRAWAHKLKEPSE